MVPTFVLESAVRDGCLRGSQLAVHPQASISTFGDNGKCQARLADAPRASPRHSRLRCLCTVQRGVADHSAASAFSYRRRSSANLLAKEAPED